MAGTWNRSEYRGAPQLGLRAHRIRNHVTLEEIADSTKISKRFLESIEAEEFDKLPGGVYNTSYLRQYARAAGFGEQELLECYYARQAEPPPGGPATGPAPPQKKMSGQGPLDWFRGLSPLRFL